MTIPDPDLAERVRKAWDEFRYTPAGRTSCEACIDIARAEYDQAEARGYERGMTEASSLAGSYLARSMERRKRPQQPDKPAEQTSDQGDHDSAARDRTTLAARGAPPALLSDAEVLETRSVTGRVDTATGHGWAQLPTDAFEGREWCILCGIRNTEPASKRACVGAQAQPAPAVDVFKAFVAEVRSGSEGRTLPWSEMEDLARDTFGPAIKALEEIDRFQPGGLCGEVLTELRERARRVTG